jgi:microcompartment protein CcmK/EutM
MTLCHSDALPRRPRSKFSRWRQPLGLRSLQDRNQDGCATIQEILMNLGKVVGTVVATRKEASMDGLKFMLVKHVDTEGKETGGQIVAVDAVGAGPGELVLVATGSSARQTLATKDRPCDAVIMAIVDSWEIGGDVKYRKD